MRTLARPPRLPVALLALALAVAACGDPGLPTASAGASAVTVVVTPSPSDATASPDNLPLPIPSDSPQPSDTASPSPSTSPTPSPPPFHGPLVATRVVVPELGIDLAITKSPAAGVYPYCNVAMYFGKPLGQPGQSRATYLFAHARDGMFGPIYQLTMVRRTPNKMVGMLVDVYTSDSKMHEYKITRVLPHQLTLNRALGARHDQLWLQTSEGPHGTPGKTMVIAEPVSVSAASYSAAHPKVRIVRCG